MDQTREAFARSLLTEPAIREGGGLDEHPRIHRRSLDREARQILSEAFPDRIGRGRTGGVARSREAPRPMAADGSFSLARVR